MSKDSAYKKWKKWDIKSFGSLSHSEKMYYESELKSFKINKKSNLNVLEIGYGNGSFLEYAKSKGWNITGVELNNELYESAKAKGFNVFLYEDLHKLNQEEYDLIIAFDVIEHIHKKNLVDFFKKIRNCLKKGGYFISRYPNGDSPFGLYYFNGDITHHSFIGENFFKYLLQESNLKFLTLRPPAEPIYNGSIIVLIHRIITKPIKFVLNLFFRLVFFPNRNVHFTSGVITGISQK
jgi:2-polyprenyl-3-methyl-5-hydroxy-6-metoxy-1,4-benzoquinol methylase